MRAASQQDLVAIMAIEKKAHFSPWSESVLTSYLNRNNTVWVLEKQQKIVGYAVNTFVAGEGELLMIAVDPSCQGKGYGREIMQFLHEHLLAQQAQEWFLEVRESNHKAIALYESLGFNQIGVRADYYPTASGREDALLFCMSLIA